METADRSGIVRFYHGNDRFPDNGVAFAASLEDAVATEETRAANEYAEATNENRATAETASAEEDEIEIEPEESNGRLRFYGFYRWRRRRFVSR